MAVAIEGSLVNILAPTNCGYCSSLRLIFAFTFSSNSTSFHTSNSLRNLTSIVKPSLLAINAAAIRLVVMFAGHNATPAASENGNASMKVVLSRHPPKLISM